MTAPERPEGAGFESVFDGGVPEDIDPAVLDQPLVSAINRILFEADPIGILAVSDGYEDAENEYRPEAETISVRLAEASSAADVVGIVHVEFCRWFTPSIAGDADRYDEVASQIWAHVRQGRDHVE